MIQLLGRLLVVSIALLLAAPVRGIEVGSLTIERLDSDRDGEWLIIQKRPVYSNSLLVETADGTLVLCDTPMTEAATHDLLEWARDRFGERDWIVVNGHFHPDCTAGNAAMIDAGAEVWANSLTAALLEARGQEFLDELADQNVADPELAEDFRATRLAVPTRVFDPERPARLPIAGERVSVHFPGAAHSPDNVVTYFEDRGLLFAGCLCFSARRETPGYIGDADLESWPETVARVQALEARVVVPGHGKPGGPELLEHTAEAIRRFREGTESSR